MSMATFLSKRVAESPLGLPRQLFNRPSPRGGAGIEAATALEEWEAEGGASTGGPRASEDEASRASHLKRRMLERLGAALVGEWHNLPSALQRAVYERAAGGSSSWRRLTLRRQMARFLHDHKARGPA